MGVLDLARFAGLMARLSRPGGDGDAGLRVERGRRDGGGAVYDVYRPAGAQRGCVVAVHGVTPNGKDDHRLQHFARSVARSGVACAVPTLPTLASLRWELADADALAAVCRELRRESGATPGLIGFSFGGSYALLAAARAPDDIRFVLTFGAIHSFEALYDDWYALRDVRPHDDKQWDEWIYVCLLHAWRNADRLALPAQTRERYLSLLRRYCDQSSPAEKRDVYERELKALRSVEVEYAAADRAALRALSPAGQLAAIRCPVAVIHDDDDRLVTPRHALALHEELQRSGAGERARVLVTPLLGHVTLGELKRLGDLAALYRMLSPILSA